MSLPPSNNAYKFVPDEGRVDVKVGVDENRFLRLSVSDDGPGVCDEDKQHLFERFYQSKDSVKGGTGIGLSLVDNYARMSGGSIHVEDNPKGGAVFVVSLPLGDGTVSGKGYVVSSREDDFDQTPAKPIQAPASRYTVLVVDDNPDFLDFLQGELQGDYHIVTAADGKDALSKVDFDRPDLILTDVMMPVMDGNELCRRIKQNEDTKRIPVMMLTARLSEENEKESRDCGADDYFKILLSAKTQNGKNILPEAL